MEKEKSKQPTARENMELVQELVAEAQGRSGKVFCEALKEIDTRHMKKPLIREVDRLRAECGKIKRWNDAMSK